MKMAKGLLPFEKKYNLSGVSMISPVQQGVLMAKMKVETKGKTKSGLKTVAMKGPKKNTVKKRKKPKTKPIKASKSQDIF